MKKLRKEYRRPNNYVPKQYSATDLAYMAGIIDGEGCFWIGIITKTDKDGYKSPHYRGVLKVTNTDKRLIDWIFKTFEGTHSAVTKHQPKAQFARKVFDWIATGDRLLDLSELVLPYLVIKKEQCENMIKFRKSYTKQQGNNVISPISLAIRQKCVEISHQLNSRFHLHPLKKHNQSSS